MPVRDHFHPPISEVAGWEEIHIQWIANLMRNPVPLELEKTYTETCADLRLPVAA